MKLRLNNDQSILKETTMTKELTYKEVWDTLSNVDCSEHIEKKMNLSYLSWAWAFGTLMEHYADAQFTFQAFADSDGIMRDAMFYPDGSASVHVTVSIGNLARSMWLPVMDNRNNAISNPTSRQISDAKMRCLVKCIAILGLGHYIFAGEDLPSEKKESGSADTEKDVSTSPPNDESAESKEVVVDDKFIEIVETFIEDVETVESLEKFWTDNKDEFKKLKTTSEATYNRLIKSFAQNKADLKKEKENE
ncbi:MAG: hypothetical protein CML19_02710 [Pusillimonas sp.]|nr:hypothetical protein [Pusillimonas sp.]|tara:strand:- start:404 stop:1150 length:747 start_codon:yes stop_codon:yes gene_type:complete